MKNERVNKSAAKGVAAVLKSVLCAEANSTSCVIIYQPKAPKELARFKKAK